MALLGISLLKLARRPASWVVLAILLGLLALVFLGLGASAGTVRDATAAAQVRLLLSFPTAYAAVVGIILSLGGLLAVTYGAAVIGAEWSRGTIRAVVARGESRVRFSLVTFVAIAIGLAIGVAVAFLLGSALAVMAAGMAGITTADATSPDTLSGLPDLVARAWLGVTLEASIGFAVAMVFRSQLAGIGAGLALYFGEIFLALVPAARDILPYLPFSVASALVRTPEGLEGGGFGTVSRLDGSTALLFAVGYLVVALGIAAWSAWRAQITQ